jgi:hypothetical protein
MKLIKLKKELRRFNSGKYNLKEDGRGYLFGSKNSIWEVDEDGYAECIADIDGDDLCIGHSENLEMVFNEVENDWFEEITLENK